jgi:hypothetical protein
MNYRERQRMIVVYRVKEGLNWLGFIGVTILVLLAAIHI